MTRLVVKAWLTVVAWIVFGACAADATGTPSDTDAPDATGEAGAPAVLRPWDPGYVPTAAGAGGAGGSAGSTPPVEPSTPPVEPPGSGGGTAGNPSPIAGAGGSAGGSAGASGAGPMAPAQPERFCKIDVGQRYEGQVFGCTDTYTQTAFSFLTLAWRVPSSAAASGYASSGCGSYDTDPCDQGTACTARDTRSGAVYTGVCL